MSVFCAILASRENSYAAAGTNPAASTGGKFRNGRTPPPVRRHGDGGTGATDGGGPGAPPAPVEAYALGLGGTGGGGGGGGCDAGCCFVLLGGLDGDATAGVAGPKPLSSDAGSRRRAQNAQEADPPPGCDVSDGGGGGSTTGGLPIVVTYILIILLVMFSGLFSGLTLGLMGLDKTGLEIVMGGDDPANARAARKIYPIRSNGNLLLCTLLLGNVAVNAMLSILTADIWGGLAGFLVSTAVIVLLGEIIPQAACSRYALQVGVRAIPLVRVIICLFYPIAAPLGFALDKVLGHELGTTYSKAEMTKLLEIHVKEGRFNQETGTAMAGALKYQDILVKEVMTPLSNTYMLSADEKLSFETIAAIFKTGYSRIPVYEVSVNNIIGLLFTKDLIFIDPEDETLVRSFIQIFGRGVNVVWPDDRLGDVLRELKQGHSHMALVRDVNNEDETQDPFYEIRGIITLEDIIEVILGDEIVDETDAFVDGQHSVKVDRAADFDWARLRLLDAKIVDETLSEDEVKAVTAHLRTNHRDAVELLSDRQLYKMVAETAVTELPAAEQEVGTDLPDDLLYEKGKPMDVCTLILGGKVTVLAGNDNFRSDVSSWSVLAPGALADASYAPDFSAYVSSGPCRCLRFTRARFMAAVDASAAERLVKGGGDAARGGGGFQSEEAASGDVSFVIGRNDVAIDMGEREVVIRGLDGVDKLEITTDSVRAASEQTDVVKESDSSRRRVAFGPETSEMATSTHSHSHDIDTKEIKQKRIKERRDLHSRRSKLLAAFLHRKDKSSDSEEGTAKEKSATTNDGGEGAEEERPSTPPNSNVLESAASAVGVLSSALGSPASSPEHMTPTQAKMSIGGAYAPKPRQTLTESSSGTASERRQRSGSLQYIASNRNLMNEADGQ